MYSEKMRDEAYSPKISIITVSYNAEATIGRAIESVLCQSYKNLEYIVIDGASTDQTTAILDRYSQEICMIMSEPDHGIYDAMNKGIRHATGDYVYFLGADDWLCNSEVMCTVSDFIAAHPGYSFYMGNVLLYQNVYRLVKRKRATRSMDDMKRGEMCPHQGLLVSRRLMQEGFNTEYRIAADYEFFLRSIMGGASYCIMDVDVAYYSVFGVSSGSDLYDEYIAVIQKYIGEEYLNRIYEIQKKDTDKNCLRNLIKRLLVTFMGERFFLRILGWKRADDEWQRG